MVTKITPPPGEAAPADTTDDLPGAGLSALDAIDAEVAAETGNAAPGAPAAPAMPATTNAQDLRQALGLLRVMAKPQFSDWPAYGTEVWNDPQLDAIAEHGGAIMDMHGWTLGEFWAKYGAYMGFAGALMLPAMATWQHLRMRKAEAAARARQAEQRSNPQPPMNTPSATQSGTP